MSDTPIEQIKTPKELQDEIFQLMDLKPVIALLYYSFRTETSFLKYDGADKHRADPLIEQTHTKKLDDGTFELNPIGDDVLELFSKVLAHFPLLAEKFIALYKKRGSMNKLLAIYDVYKKT